MKGNDRRREIMGAALDCFVENGYSATGIEEIRRRSGASIGSIYHFFGSKDGVAVALFAEGMRSWAEASLGVPEEGTAEDVVRGAVERTIDWALANEKLYKYMETTRWLAPLAAAQREMAEILAKARQRGEEMLALLVARGEVRPLPWDIAHSLILGPAYDYLLLWSNQQADTPPEAAKRLLGSAAWEAVRRR